MSNVATTPAVRERANEIHSEQSQIRFAKIDRLFAVLLVVVFRWIDGPSLVIAIAAFAAYAFSWMDFRGRYVMFVAVVGLLVVLGCALAFDLDPGTAAGLGAGGLTSSPTIGTADDAITELPGVTSEQVDDLQTNLAVGFAITYLFGQVGPILAVTWLIPQVMRWDLRREAKAKAQRMSAGVPVLEPGQVDAAERLQTRFFVITGSSELAGHTVGDIDAQVHRMLRNVESLLAGQAAGPEHLVSLTTYLKRPEYLGPLDRGVDRRRFPVDLPHAVTVADVCRPDWLCEMEAIAVLPTRSLR